MAFALHDYGRQGVSRKAGVPSVEALERGDDVAAFVDVAAAWTEVDEHSGLPTMTVCNGELTVEPARNSLTVLLVLLFSPKRGAASHPRSKRGDGLR